MEKSFETFNIKFFAPNEELNNKIEEVIQLGYVHCDKLTKIDEERLSGQNLFTRLPADLMPDDVDEPVAVFICDKSQCQLNAVCALRQTNICDVVALDVDESFWAAPWKENDIREIYVQVLLDVLKRIVTEAYGDSKDSFKIIFHENTMNLRMRELINQAMTLLKGGGGKKKSRKQKKKRKKKYSIYNNNRHATKRVQFRMQKTL
jgi:hypothetical protein